MNTYWLTKQMAGPIGFTKISLTHDKSMVAPKLIYKIAINVITDMVKRVSIKRRSLSTVTGKPLDSSVWFCLFFTCTTTSVFPVYENLFF